MDLWIYHYQVHNHLQFPSHPVNHQWLINDLTFDDGRWGFVATMPTVCWMWGKSSIHVSWAGCGAAAGSEGCSVGFTASCGHVALKTLIVIGYNPCIIYVFEASNPVFSWVWGPILVCEDRSWNLHQVLGGWTHINKGIYSVHIWECSEYRI